jgi:small subunit ribosomal protein S17
MPKRQVIGVVTSDRMAKTRRVEIRRKTRHPLYGKFVASRTICYVHDEENQSHEGDTVEIIESRPMSKLKRWQLVRIVQKSTTVDVAMLKAARKAEMDAEQEFLEQGERPAQRSHDDDVKEEAK